MVKTQAGRTQKPSERSSVRSEPLQARYHRSIRVLQSHTLGMHGIPSNKIIQNQQHNVLWRGGMSWNTMDNKYDVRVMNSRKILSVSVFGCSAVCTAEVFPKKLCKPLAFAWDPGLASTLSSGRRWLLE